MKNQSVSSSSSSSDSLTRPDLLSSEKHFSERVRTPSPLAGWYIAQPTMGKGDGWIKNAHKARYNMFCFFCLLFFISAPNRVRKAYLRALRNRPSLACVHRSHVRYRSYFFPLDHLLPHHNLLPCTSLTNESSRCKMASKKKMSVFVCVQQRGTLYRTQSQSVNASRHTAGVKFCAAN